MKKSDLKKIIKPLVKECINEVLLEEGLLSGIVSEVAKGMTNAPLVEHTPVSPPPAPQQVRQTKKDLEERRQKLREAISRDAYNGVDLFEGTEALPAKAPTQGAVDLGDPRDPGVDISSIMGTSSKIWQAMK